MTGNELEALVMRCLEEGVPPGVVARVFDLDPDLIAEAEKTRRVKEYNTDDMSEYIERLRWETLKDAYRALESGSVSEKRGVYAMVLGKEFAMSARRTPESVRNSQGTIYELMEEMRSGKAKETPPRSKFIARLDDTGTDA